MTLLATSTGSSAEELLQQRLHHLEQRHRALEQKLNGLEQRMEKCPLVAARQHEDTDVVLLLGGLQHDWAGKETDTTRRLVKECETMGFKW